MAIEIKELVIRALINPDYGKEGDNYSSSGTKNGDPKQENKKDKDKSCHNKEKREQQQETINQFSEIMRNEKER